MNPRDDLYDLIDDAVEHAGRDCIALTDHIHDAIRAAGFSRPQVVESVEELEALPDGSVVRDGESCICERDADGWLITGSRNGYIHRDILLPATVLYVPQEAK